MRTYDRSPPNIGRTRAEHALNVRSERPTAYLVADVVSPLLLAGLWLILPFEASTGSRWAGAIAIALVGPFDQLVRQRSNAKWANIALLGLRCAVAIALAALVPIMWHPSAIVVAAIVIGSMPVESTSRVVVLGAASTTGLAAAAIAHDVTRWYLSVAVTLVLFAAHGAWYRAWDIERSEVDLRHDEMVDRALMFSWEIDTINATVLSVVGNVEAVLGWTADELIGDSVAKFANVESERAILKNELALPTGERHVVVNVTHKDGHTVTVREVRLASRQTGVLRGVSIDITELAEATEALRHQAEHDALTGLVNRSVVETLVTDRLESEADEATSLALVVADLDRFKEINDTLGHPTGDRLLRVLADRLSTGLADLDVVARLGGDEFAFVAFGPHTAAEAVALGERVHGLMTTPVPVDGLELAVACSVGVAIAPDHGASYADLLKHADIATYEAKRSGGGVRLYATTPDTLSVQRLQFISETAAALDRGEFELHFQPQVDIATGQIDGVEGLARWRHPEHGLLSPGAFLSVIEVAADYYRFTNEMLRQAISFAGEAKAAGRPVQVAVNLGSRSFLDQGLPALVSDLLATHDVAPSSLTLEVTESYLLEDPSGEGPVFGALEALGVCLSIDDFGTGYSTFTRLRRLNVDEVKIDREFVQGLGRTQEDAIIVRSTIRLAQLLGLKVVAEGVETAEQLTWLQRFGCPSAQGFLWSAAVHRDVMHDMLRSDTIFEVGDPRLARTDAPQRMLNTVVKGSLSARRAEPAVRAAFTQLFDQIAAEQGKRGIVIRDSASRLVEANATFRGFTGIQFFDQFIGSRYEDFAKGPHHGEFAGERFTLSRATSADGGQVLILHLEHRTLVLRSRASRLVDAAGHDIGVVIVHRLAASSETNSGELIGDQ